MPSVNRIMLSVSSNSQEEEVFTCMRNVGARLQRIPRWIPSVGAAAVLLIRTSLISDTFLVLNFSLIFSNWLTGLFLNIYRPPIETDQ